MEPTRNPLSRPSLHAPVADRSVMTEPAWEVMPALVRRNLALARLDRRVFGSELAAQMVKARSELIHEARRWTATYRDVGPPEAHRPERVFLAGHQPQLYHPGVWLKNFALSDLAARLRATAINLIIDGDAAKEPVLAVPGGTADAPSLETIAFDQPRAEVPFEERGVVDLAMFTSFGRRAGEMIRPLVAEPLLEQFWPIVLDRHRATGRLGAALAQARHLLEARWGGQTLEVPQSRLCDTESFAWFAVHLMDDLARFQAVYNRALADHRHAFRIRGDARPMPDLAAEGDWLEAPFWLWTGGDPRRRRLFVRIGGDRLELSNRAGLTVTLPRLGDDDQKAIDAYRSLAERGVKIRSRALMTTLWARLVLGDVFLHGIGGANYDRVTDLLIERYFGLEPPEWIVLSATMHLPIPRQDAPHDLHAIDRALRELTYHPENAPDAANHPLVAEKRRWIATPPSVENAKARCRAIRTINQSLQPLLGARRAELLDRRAAAERAMRAEKILTWREYAFCLFPAPPLRNFLQGLLPKRAETWSDAPNL